MGLWGKNDLERPWWFARPCVFLGVLAAAFTLNAGCTRHQAAPSTSQAKVDPDWDYKLIAPTGPYLKARLLPASLDSESPLGADSSGGVRYLVGGTRVLVGPDGNVRVARQRFSERPASVMAIPNRLGNGYVFALGPNLMTSAHWLDDPRYVHNAPFPIAQVIAGFDRLYLRSLSGAFLGVDAKTGLRLDGGPLPAAPFVGAFAVADGWRGAALADLIGPIVTSNAGSSWEPVDLPITARDVSVDGPDLRIVGRDDSGSPKAFRLLTTGEILADDTPETAAIAHRPVRTSGRARSIPGLDAVARAISSGHLLDDGTAMVVTSGDLLRIRLDDGAVVARVEGAVASKSSQCQALPLGDRTAGFVCSISRGETSLLALPRGSHRFVDLKRFGDPRVVLPSGNGNVAVRGGCANLATRSSDYCIRFTNGSWREVRLEGGDERERLVALSDGRIVIVSPPRRSDETGHLTILDGPTSRKVPLTAVGIDNTARALLTNGFWLEGFEQRSTDIVGGWVQTGGTFVGIEVSMAGTVRVGPYIRELGAPVVAGRFGIGWSASRRGYETTNGGMTWSSIDVPDSLRPTSERACSAVGAIAGGWLRVGWSSNESDIVAKPGTVDRTQSATATGVDLRCAVTNSLASASRPIAPPPATMNSTSSRPRSTSSAKPPTNAPSDDAIGSFYSDGAPIPRNGETLVHLDAFDTPDRSYRGGALARVLASGPTLNDWFGASRWSASWVFPFDTTSKVHRTSESSTPFSSIDAARRSLGLPPTPALLWSFALGDDATRALLIGRRPGSADTVVYAIDEGQALLRLDTPEGNFEVDSAKHIGGRWYLSGPASVASGSFVALYTLHGTEIRPWVRLPRAGFDLRPISPRLAASRDGRYVGIVVDGQPDGSRPIARRWVLPIPVDSGRPEWPILLGPIDLADKPRMAPCSGDEDGWSMDIPYVHGGVRLKTAKGKPTSFQNTLIRMRMSTTRACLDAISGSVEPAVLGDLPNYTKGAEGGQPSIPVIVNAGERRLALRCWNDAGAH